MGKVKGLIAEFKEFISRGNVIDLAVGIIIGSAFTAIVTSMVNDMIMPIIGIVLNKINFMQLRYVLRSATETSPESAILYGHFIQSIVNFLLIALVVFLLVKIINRLHKNSDESKNTKEPTEDIILLREIRDSLKKQEKNDNNMSEN